MEAHSLVNGALRLVQPDEKSGLRVNVDTILLAHFARPKAGERILEIGCAHGAISLILAKRGTLLSPRGFDVTGVDIRPDLVELARANAESNGLKAEFVAADVREYKKIAPAQSFDRIVVNPPYDEAESSRRSPSDGRAAALLQALGESPFLGPLGQDGFLVFGEVGAVGDGLEHGFLSARGQPRRTARTPSRSVAATIAARLSASISVRLRLPKRTM